MNVYESRGDSVYPSTLPPHKHDAPALGDLGHTPRLAHVPRWFLLAASSQARWEQQGRALEAGAARTVLSSRAIAHCCSRGDLIFKEDVITGAALQRQTLSLLATGYSLCAAK